MLHLNTIEEAISELKLGKPVVLIEERDEPGQAYLVGVAGLVTSATLGLINDHSLRGTTFKVLDDHAIASDFEHMGDFPVIKGVKGGVLKRASAAEASVDLARLSGAYPAGLVARLAGPGNNGGPSIQEVAAFAGEQHLKLITLEDVIRYIHQTGATIRRSAEAEMPTKYGHFKMVGYENLLNGEHHVALVKGDVSDGAPVLVRVHSECLTGDAFGSLRCDCGEQYAAAVKAIEKERRGVLLYMRQEGRGIGLINKIRAYALQDQGMDTVEANLALGFPEDMRDYGIGAQILADLGIRQLRLMTNNPRKLNGLTGYGLEIVERVPIQMNHNERNAYYLKTKKAKLGHMLKSEE